MRRTITLLACLGALTLAVACGRSDEEQARDAVQEYVEAGDGGDYERACELLSEAFKREQRLLANCERALRARDRDQGEVNTEIATVRVRGNTATVDLNLTREGQSASRLVLLLRRPDEDADWRIAAQQ